MTEFRISASNIVKMLSLISLTDKFDKDKTNEQPVTLVVDKDNSKLFIYENGVQSMTDCVIDITDVKADPLVKGNPYVCISLTKFKTALAKCRNGDMTMKLNHDGKSTSFIPDNGSVFTLFCFDTVTDAEVEERTNYWKNHLETEDFKNNRTIKITSDMMQAADVAGRFISRSADASASAYDTLAVLFEDNKVKYTDKFVILEKEINDNVNGSFYVPKNVLDFIRPIVKDSTDGVELHFTDNDSYIYFDANQIGLRTIIGIPDVTFRHPTAEEYASVTPEDSNCVKVTTTKDDLLSALGKFDGIFNVTDYFWKQVRVYSSEDLLAKNNVRLQYDDYTADVDTYFTAQLVSNTSSEEEFNFLVPGYIIETLLDLADDDSIEITYSSVAPSVMHGQSIVLKSTGFNAACLKLTD